MKPLIILENIRSAYNVGNIIRTADALGYDVLLSGFTPNPNKKAQVKKTSLGAEESVGLKSIWNTSEAIAWVKEQGYTLVAAECSDYSIELNAYEGAKNPVAIVMGNENTGVLPETLLAADAVLYIPMQGIKESLNVGQAAAIMMWELVS